MKTIFKRHGNKSKYLKHILPYVPVFQGTYIEPFAGTGALFLKLSPSKWIINDLNKDVISTWKLIKNHPDSLLTMIKMFSKGFLKLSNFDKYESCKRLTDQLNYEIPKLSRSIIYFLMNHCIYASIQNTKGVYIIQGMYPAVFNNVLPISNEKYQENIKNVSCYLNRTRGKITSKDYSKVISKAKEGDFVFLDPPYLDNDPGLKYNTEENIDKIFVDTLLENLKELDNKNVKWLMTQGDNPMIRKKFKKYTIIEYPVYRVFSNTRAVELIIKNY